MQWWSKVKVKVTKPTNAETGSVSYLPKGKAYELQTRYVDGTRRHASATSAVISKVARSRDASDRCEPIGRERNVLETPKLVGRLSTPRTIMRTSFKIKVTRPTNAEMLRPEGCYVFRMGRPTNFKIAMPM